MLAKDLVLHRRRAGLLRVHLCRPHSRTTPPTHTPFGARLSRRPWQTATAPWTTRWRRLTIWRALARRLLHVGASGRSTTPSSVCLVRCSSVCCSPWRWANSSTQSVGRKSLTRIFHRIILTGGETATRNALAGRRQDWCTHSSGSWAGVGSFARACCPTPVVRRAWRKVPPPVPLARGGQPDHVSPQGL